jgi:hypothetical protein
MLSTSLLRDSSMYSYAQYTQPQGFISSNLFLNLDAYSYSGSGNTWYDLSGNNRNVSLINNPTYNTSQNGYFHFTDTSFQYAITLNTVPDITRWTVEAWYRPTKSLTGKVTSVITNEFDLINKINYSLGNNNAPSSYTLAGGYYNGAWRTTTGFTPSINTWVQSVVSYNGTQIIQYTNGVSQSTLSYSGTPQSGGKIRISRRWDDSATSIVNFFDGDISIIRIYDIALSSSQVLQNYNAIKERYSL